MSNLSGAPVRSACVLVVEDDLDVGALLRRHLEALGHQVTHVVTGEDALLRAAQTPPDVAVVDIGLPGVDGREVVRRLRAQSSTAGCAVVITSVLDPDDFGVPADARLHKPFRRRDVSHAMATIGYGNPSAATTSPPEDSVWPR